MEELALVPTNVIAALLLLEEEDFSATMELTAKVQFAIQHARTRESAVDQINVHVKELDLQVLCATMMRMNASENKVLAIREVPAPTQLEVINAVLVHRDSMDLLT